MAGATSLVELILKKWGAPAAGVAAAGQSDDADAGFVTKGGKTLLEAFHGSPHKFDKFSMDQIGTGEGAQAYGHGLYFADDIDEAKRYQPRDHGQEEDLYRLYHEAEESGDQYMMDAWERAMLQDSPIELRASAVDPDYDEHSQAAFAEVADYLESNPGEGSLIRAEIDVSPDEMIDWEKSLKDQPRLNDALERLGYFDQYPNDRLSDEVTGSMAYQSLFDLHGDVKRNQMLKDDGIRGLSYPAENPTRGQNHVIFDDSLINIAERGNADPRLLAGTAAGTAGLLGLAGSDDADAAVSLRLLKEAPEAYNSLRKQIARGRQKGLSPQRVAEKFIHDQSMTNYDKGFNSYARKVDGMESGDYWKEGVQSLYDEIMGAVDEPDPMVAEAMGGWLDSHLGREAGVSMAENRARALKKRKAAAAAGGGLAGGAAGGASADEGLPVPTWGDVGESLFTVLDMPMTGLQGMARGIGGLLSGEDMVTAAAEANHMMGGGSEEGWDRVGKKVTEKTGDETLGFYAKWLPSLLSPF